MVILSYSFILVIKNKTNIPVSCSLKYIRLAVHDFTVQSVSVIYLHCERGRVLSIIYFSWNNGQSDLHGYLIGKVNFSIFCPKIWPRITNIFFCKFYYVSYINIVEQSIWNNLMYYIKCILLVQKSVTQVCDPQMWVIF